MEETKEFLNGEPKTNVPRPSIYKQKNDESITKPEDAKPNVSQLLSENKSEKTEKAVYRSPKLRMMDYGAKLLYKNPAANSSLSKSRSYKYLSPPHYSNWRRFKSQSKSRPKSQK